MVLKVQQRSCDKPEKAHTGISFYDYFLEELRRHPKVETNFGAEVTTEWGGSAIAVVSNLSQSGCRLESSRKFIAAILPNINHLEKKLPCKVLVTFLLSPLLTITPKEVSAICSLVFTRRLNQQTYQLGCQFIEFYGNSGQYIQSYLSNAEPD